MPPSSPLQPPLPAATQPEALFSYPSVDPGFPALPVDTLLEAHSDLLARIKICYGTDRATFEEEVLALVRRYAAYVHLLPATPANYFNEPGGLLRLGLETAFFALQGTDAHIFSGRATISARRRLEPRWRLATFIAGLCAEIHRSVGRVVVTDRDGSEWQPYLQGLQPWLDDHLVARYYLKWLPTAPESPGLALFSLPLIVPAATLQHLAQGNTVVVPHMLASLSGVPLHREHNILADLVRRAAALVIDRFLQASADRYGRPQLGSHLERYLLDAMRRLVATHPAWTPNAERSRVWFGPDGLFIIWPNAATDMRKLLEGDQLPGIPKAAETMLEILLEAGVVTPREGQEVLWTIHPPGSKTGLEAVRLSQPDSILSSMDPRPQPLTEALTSPAAPQSASAAPITATGSASAVALKPIPRPTEASAAPTSPPLDAPPSAAPLPEAETEREADRSTPPEPWQLELPVSGPPDAMPAQSAIEAGDGHPAPPDAPGTAGTSTEADSEIFTAPPPAAPSLTLQVPMRLAPRIGAALTDIVQALNVGEGPPLACATDDGLVVALAEFERRHIEPSTALRSLAEARMLVGVPGAKAAAARCSIRGQDCLALTIAPTFLAGGPASAPIPAPEPQRL